MEQPHELVALGEVALGSLLVGSFDRTSQMGELEVATVVVAAEVAVVAEETFQTAFVDYVAVEE